MQITLKKSELIVAFFNPIQLVSDTAVVQIKHDSMECLATSVEPQTILFCKYPIATDLKPDHVITLNFPNIKKFITALKCIKDDFITLKINSNNIGIGNADNTLFFKYHLMEDGLIAPSTVKMEDVRKMGFDFSTEATSTALGTLMTNGFFTETEKRIYLYTKDDKVFCQIGNETVANSDMVDMLFSESFQGPAIKTPLIFDFEIFRRLFNVKSASSTLKLNTQNGILMFEPEGHAFVIQLIATALTK